MEWRVVVKFVAVSALFFGMERVEAAESSTLSNISDTSTVQMVVVVHRHGDRYSLKVDRSSSSRAEIERKGQLTELGVLQLFHQGQFLRNRYPRIDDGEIMPSKRIMAMSSEVDRTMNSAQALLAGLLPPQGTNRTWNNTLGGLWAPFPVHNVLFDSDSIIRVQADACPEYDKIRKGINELPIARELRAREQLFIEFVRPHVLKYSERAGEKRDISEKFFEACEVIHDAIYYIRRQSPEKGGRPWPAAMDEWMNSTLAAKFEFIADIRMHIMAGGNGDFTTTKFRTGNLLRDAFHRMNKSLTENGQDKSRTTMAIYSGHDENVAAMRAAFGDFNFDINSPTVYGVPHFGALVIMELHYNDTIRVLWKNASTPPEEPYELKAIIHPKCPMAFCPRNRLRAVLHDVIVSSDEEWANMCGLGVPSITTGPLEPAVVAAIVLAIMFIPACVLAYIVGKRGGCRKASGENLPLLQDRRSNAKRRGAP
ncbi:hypothetical protein BV898_09305 [Hypsibius exemplaris]|uniref:acid phosphatase n=1 Tax=Hypsibius exemplaris TaxID=2072580 RepID=A0A1W0WN98_HYPEX|nr:hypothetical protein BV898_09305 [Hypsibius exemplaris]